MNKLFGMRLLETIRRVLIEYIEENASKLFETTIKNKKFIYYDSSHLYHIRPATGNVRYTKKDEVNLRNILQQTSSFFYNRYWRMYTQLPDVDIEDPYKKRYHVKKIINGEEISVLLQLEELDRTKGATFVIITYFDEKGLKMRETTKFIINLK